jgi:hypothetical protein
MFELAGVGLGEENWLLISNAVKVNNKSLNEHLAPCNSN